MLRRMGEMSVRHVHLAVHLESVATLAIRLERGLKGESIELAFHCRSAPRGESLARLFWQDQKVP